MPPSEENTGPAKTFEPRPELVLRLAAMAGTTVDYFDGKDNEHPEWGEGVSVSIGFTNYAYVNISYWRLSVAGRAIWTSFDHGKVLGSVKLDSLKELRAAVMDKTCLSAQLDPQTDDLHLLFAPDVLVVAFSFRSLFEDWEVKFDDGLAFWSNQLATTPTAL